MPHILVVDDDTAICRFVEMLLRRHGHEVTVAASGRAGIDALERHRFDAVLIDIFMPGMDGLETIRCFHDRMPEVPLIAMSGFLFREAHTPPPDFLRMATKLGARYSLQKPFRSQQLLAIIEACVGDADRPRQQKSA